MSYLRVRLQFFVRNLKPTLGIGCFRAASLRTPLYKCVGLTIVPSGPETYRD
ncbi:unnamed protein product [Penicillium nalgiovense]|nr:unnamed protein product [Penicillium nalgiovense]CAG8145694.1 unnamed protein product [Penicillium nalgiovense]CAG8933110.1 unnamed protein product [Penicillium nalgiovense]